MIIPHWLSEEPKEYPKNIPKIKFNLIALKQIAKEKIEIDDKQQQTELAKKMNNPYYFTDRIPNTTLNIISDSQLIK